LKKLLLISTFLLLTACGEVDNVVNDFKSSTGLLDRIVTLYANDGHVIKTWNTTNLIEYNGPVAAFVDKQGTNVRVSGTFIVEGK
jgi:hypothetical protein